MKTILEVNSLKKLGKELILKKAIKEQWMKKISLLTQRPGVQITTEEHIITYCSSCPSEMPLYKYII